jgi:SAM-dependent methyltransferase
MPPADALIELYSAGDSRVIGAGWDNATAQSANSGTIAGNHWICTYLKRAEVSPGTCLEIGPGDGSLMRALQVMGWRCLGVEPGPWLKSGEIVPDLTSLPTDLEVDILILHDVLEHMSDPVKGLQDAAEFLTPGGLLFAAFPFAESLDAKVLGSGWPMVRPLGHLNYFSQRSAEMLMESASTRIVCVAKARVTTRFSSLLLLCRRPLSALYGGIKRKSAKEFWRRLRLLRGDVIGLVSSGDQLHVVARKRQNDSGL